MKIFSRLLLCAGLLWAPRVLAIVNLAELHSQEYKKGFTGSAELSLDGASGNTDKANIALGGILQWRHDPAQDLLVINYSYGESQGTTNTRKAFLHGRHIMQFAPRRAWEVFAQLQNDAFARLSLRALAGAGIRLNPLPAGGPGRILLGLGVFYEHEQLNGDVTIGESLRNTTWRGNIYLIAAYPAQKRLSLSSTTYYQPALQAAGDFRLLEEAALKIGINGILDLKLSLNLSYDSEPPATVSKHDASYNTGFVIRLP